jgi:hypothetical protein
MRVGTALNPPGLIRGLLAVSFGIIKIGKNFGINFFSIDSLQQKFYTECLTKEKPWI